MIQLFTSVGLWRQQLRPTARVHGIITEGGTAANIIPDRTSAWFMIRSDDQAYYEEMKTQFSRDGRGGGAGDGHDRRRDLLGWRHDDAQQPSARRAVPGEHGAPTASTTWATIPNAGSTDMANVSWVCPTIHPDLAICEEGVRRSLDRLPRRGGDPRADETTLLAATLIAQTAIDLFIDPALVEAAWTAFRED